MCFRQLLAAALCCGLLLLLVAGNPLSFVPKLLEAWFPERYVNIANIHLFLGDIPKLPQDLLFGGVIVLLIISVRGQIPEGKIWDQMTSAIRFFAGSTFTLYAFHVPLLYFFIACLKVDRFSTPGLTAVAVLVFASCMLLSYIGERRVAWYRSFFLNIFSRLRSLWARLLLAA